MSSVAFFFVGPKLSGCLSVCLSVCLSCLAGLVWPDLAWSVWSGGLLWSALVCLAWSALSDLSGLISSGLSGLVSSGLLWSGRVGSHLVSSSLSGWSRLLCLVGLLSSGLSRVSGLVSSGLSGWVSSDLV